MDSSEEHLTVAPAIQTDGVKHVVGVRTGRWVKKCLADAEPGEGAGKVLLQLLKCLYSLFFPLNVRLSNYVNCQ